MNFPHKKLAFSLTIFLILTNTALSQKKVINNCGSKGYIQPSNPKDCKDDNEKHCRFVTVKFNDGSEVKYCAIVHGDYDNDEAIDSFKQVASKYDVASITVKNAKGSKLFVSLTLVLFELIFIL